MIKLDRGIKDYTSPSEFLPYYFIIPLNFFQILIILTV